MKVYASRVIISALLLIAMMGCEKKLVLQTTTIKVDTLSQIILLRDSLVQPIIYTHVSGLEKQPVNDAKQLFISVILPSVLIAKHQLSTERQKIHDLKSSDKWVKDDSTYYHHLKLQYKANDIENLLQRMTTVPNSIILAQAAVESGWGQSRFFREGNNVFGMWSYNQNEPRLKASRQRAKGSVHVRAYKDISHSILDYYKTLGTARAYRNLRAALQETTDPYELLPHLKYYSEGRMAYVKQLKKIIEQNNLTQYDHFVIDPSYFVAQ